MIAALYVQPNGIYAGIEGVELWDEQRDARRYAGPHPVVAHPPCARWCRLAGLVEARWGHKKGDDGGTFVAALESVNRWGGVLEHPAHTAAFAAHGIPAPGVGGWQRNLDGSWVCHVEQRHYGHRAKKATWLYYVGGKSPEALDWSTQNGAEPSAWGNRNGKRGNVVERMGHRERSATPQAFRDVLLALAAGARISTT
jgi:hypothetical protein